MKINPKKIKVVGFRHISIRSGQKCWYLHLFSQFWCRLTCYLSLILSYLFRKHFVCGQTISTNLTLIYCLHYIVVTLSCYTFIWASRSKNVEKAPRLIFFLFFSMNKVYERKSFEISRQKHTWFLMTNVVIIIHWISGRDRLSVN